MVEEMTDAEIKLRFDAVERGLSGLTDKVDHLPDKIRETYVSREVYEAHRTAQHERSEHDRSAIAKLEKEVGKISRLLWFGVGAAAALGSAAGSTAVKLIGG